MLFPRPSSLRRIMKNDAQRIAMTGNRLTVRIRQMIEYKFNFYFFLR